MTVMTIKFVNHPKEATSKFGSIVDSAGTRYPCPKALIGGFQQGQTYDVPTKQEDWKSGPVVVIAGPPVAAQAPAAAAPQQAAPASTGHNSGNNGYGDGKDGQIFVTGVMQRMMGSGKYEAANIPLIAQTLVAAWNDHIKGKL